MRRSAPALCALAVLAVAVGGAQAAAHLGEAETARIVVPTVVRAFPGAGAPLQELATRTSWAGLPQRLLVLGEARGRDGREWLRVRLPGRPNQSAGWIRRDVAELARTPWFLEISLSRRLVRVLRAGRLVRTIPAVVGAPATPTPQGLFAVYEDVPQHPAGGFLGPWAIHLTAFSDVLDDYGGGPGRIAIHGRGGASLLDPLGSARSHGCIRIDNAEVDWLARHVPPGSPVRIGP